MLFAYAIYLSLESRKDLWLWTKECQILRRTISITLRATSLKEVWRQPSQLSSASLIRIANLPSKASSVKRRKKVSLRQTQTWQQSILSPLASKEHLLSFRLRRKCKEKSSSRSLMKRRMRTRLSSPQNRNSLRARQRIVKDAPTFEVFPRMEISGKPCSCLRWERSI